MNKPKKSINDIEGPINARYLGDGVYAWFDGYHILLDLRGQDNTTKIAMEPEVLYAFDKYRKWLKEQKSE